MEKQKNFKTQRGITLVALIITIIVLVILAAVAINVALNTGIINFATKGVKDYAEAGVEENRIMNKAMDFMTNTVNKIEGILGENIEELKEPAPIYVSLYDDGTLAFSSKNNTIEGKTLEKSYGDIKGKVFTGSWQSSSSDTLWYNDREQISTVKFVDQIVPENTAFWFFQCTKLKQIENIENLKTSKVTDMSYMFSNCENLESLDVSKFNTSNVTSLHSMFFGCYKIKTLDLSNFDTSNVTNMRGMFDSCRMLSSIDVSSFDTSDVTDMAWMFGEPTSGYYMSLTEIIGLDNFDTRKVKDMNNMFCRCSKLKSIIVGENWVTAPTNYNMFYGCSVSSVTKKTS